MHLTEHALLVLIFQRVAGSCWCCVAAVAAPAPSCVALFCGDEGDDYIIVAFSYIGHIQNRTPGSTRTAKSCLFRSLFLTNYRYGAAPICVHMAFRVLRTLFSTIEDRISMLEFGW